MPLTLTFSISFLITLFVAWKLAKEQLFHERVIFDSVILTFIGAVIGARLLHILFHFSDFGYNVLRFLVFGLYPGFSVGGAFLGVAVVYWILSDKKTLVPFPELVDIITRALYIGIPVFLLGGLFGFAEQGGQFSGPVSFPLFSTILVQHPVTLYKFAVFVAFAVLFHRFRSRKIKFSPGIESVLFWFGVCMSFFSIDFFKRFDVYYWRFGVDQWVYVILSIILVVIIVFQIKRKAIFTNK